MCCHCDKESLFPQQLVDIHVVILHKEEGAGLGFSIAGGSDLESKAPTVSSTDQIHTDHTRTRVRLTGLSVCLRF